MPALNKFRVEIDGFPLIRAMGTDFGDGKKAQLASYQPGNEVRPVYGPSTVTVSEFSFTHATGEGNVETLFNAWFDRFHAGLDTKRNARVVMFDNTGRVPVRTWELLNCCPTGINPGEHTGGETDRVSEFSFSLQPEDARPV